MSLLPFCMLCLTVTVVNQLFRQQVSGWQMDEEMEAVHLELAEDGSYYCLSANMVKGKG